MAEYSKHALKIYERLYFLRDNDDNYIETSPEQTHKRVCSYIANNEEEYERFKYMFDEQIFRCNTPCFLNAGITHRNNHDGNLCACFVVGLEDSLISISEMYQTAMLIYSSGAGMGAHIGTLREEKASLSTGGFSSGPISFLRVIQVLSDTVRSGGRNRRAANFFDMWYNHPDIIKFINCKSEEDLSAMNISVILDKQFFEALDKDATIDLISPTGHKRGSIKASEIWDVLISNAWKTGDPGCFFYDNVNKFNKVPSAGAITCSNPCLPEWAPVKTPDGYKPLSKIKDKIFMNGETHTSSPCFRTKERADVYEIILDSGLCLYATADHPILTSDGFVQVRDLKLQETEVCVDYSPIEYSLNSNDYKNGLITGLTYKNKKIDLFEKTISYQIGFINGFAFDQIGIFDDGLTILNTQHDILKQIQVILTSLNVFSYQTIAGLVIPDIENFLKHFIILEKSLAKQVKKLASKKDFMSKFKNWKSYQKIKSIEYYSIEPVYDITVPEKHSFVTSGAIVHNCGEVPLRDWSTCNLGSINTYKFIKNGKFDDEGFKEWIPWAVRFLDNVIDKTNYINDKFKKNMLQFRPVGLGIMGFADTCYELGLRYDSEEAISLLEHISKVLTKTAYEYSIDVVHSNEKTPAYIPPSDTKHFLNLLKHYEVDEEHLDAFIECGIRNTEVTCFAPTGSTALSADASYSFEPIFALSFKKTLVDTNEVMYITNKVFEKTLPLIAKEINKDPKEILDDITSEQNKGSIQHIKYIPQKYKDVFVVAHDINPEKRIEIQGKAQNYITMAISSTVNLPNTASKDDVANIYRLAHKHGLKGITIYRDGCKDFQPIEFNKDSKKDNRLETNINERPIVRYGKTVEVKTSQGKLFLTGNYINDKVAEVFIRLSKQGSLVAVLTDALARCISKGLQHGVNIECYIDTLIDLQGETFWTKINPENDGNELVYSIPDAIAKILLYHFANGNNQLALEESLDPTLKMCPSCNRRGIKPGHGGCRSGSCIYCGYSACGG